MSRAAPSVRQMFSPAGSGRLTLLPATFFNLLQLNNSPKFYSKTICKIWTTKFSIQVGCKLVLTAVLTGLPHRLRPPYCPESERVGSPPVNHGLNQIFNSMCGLCLFQPAVVNKTANQANSRIPIQCILLIKTDDAILETHLISSLLVTIVCQPVLYRLRRL